MFTESQNEPRGEFCPRCNDNRLKSIKTMNALSRVDHETYICSDCGIEESLINTGSENSEESLLRDLSFRSKLKANNTEESDREKLVSTP